MENLALFSVRAVALLGGGGSGVSRHFEAHALTFRHEKTPFVRNKTRGVLCGFNFLFCATQEQKPLHFRANGQQGAINFFS